MSFASLVVQAAAPVSAGIYSSLIVQAAAPVQAGRWSSLVVQASAPHAPGLFASVVTQWPAAFSSVGIRGQQFDGSGTLTTDNLVPGALEASEYGRSIMEAGFFDTEAMFAARVAAAIINGDRLAGIKLAGSKLVDLALLTSKIANSAFTSVKMADAFFDLEATFSGKVDPAVVNGDRLVNTTLSADKIENGVLTLAKFLNTGVKSYGFTGRNGAGAITLTGAAINDRVVALFQTDATNADARTLFQSAITVTNQIQQTSAANLSANRFIVWLWGAAA